MRLVSRLSSRLGGLPGEFLLLGALALMLSGPLAAQCVMCRESAKYQRGEALRALNLGIIVLALPPVAIGIGIGWVTYRHRNSSQPTPQSRHESSDL